MKTIISNKIISLNKEKVHLFNTVHYIYVYEMILIGGKMKLAQEDNKYIHTIVGKNIKRIRKEKGLTQVQLADLIGYNEGTIANIENDSFQTCSLEFLYVISKALDIPMTEFFKEI